MKCKFEVILSNKFKLRQIANRNLLFTGIIHILMSSILSAHNIMCTTNLITQYVQKQQNWICYELIMNLLWTFYELVINICTFAIFRVPGGNQAIKVIQLR